MPFYGRFIFPICMCAVLTACVQPPTYIDPQLEGADDGEIAELEGYDVQGGLEKAFLKVDSITDAEGNDIPVISTVPQPSSQKPNKLRFDEFRLPPGKYKIEYSALGGKALQRWLASGNSRIFLKRGHIYELRSETCFAFCSRMLMGSTDIWLRDKTAGERVGGCRQGRGCVGN